MAVWRASHERGALVNILHRPELLDHLAASYALGTLRGGARRRFETLARQSASIRTAALIWQERLASMTELQAAEIPSPNVWKRIENLVQAEGQPRAATGHVPDSSMLQRLQSVLRWWRMGALAGGVASLVAVTVAVRLEGEIQGQGRQLAEVTQQKGALDAQLRAVSQIEYVAVLSDDKANASLLVTFDPRNQRMTLKRVGGFQEAADKSLQLWALPPSGKPQSLGVLAAGPVIRLSAQEAQVREVPALAISLEPKGGVSSETGPTGPVLFKGALLQTTL